MVDKTIAKYILLILKGSNNRENVFCFMPLLGIKTQENTTSKILSSVDYILKHIPPSLML